MAIIWTGLAPHPPIIVESVGGDRCADAQPTIDAMHALVADMIHHKPQRLVLISPHTPRPVRGISAWTGGHVSGSFGDFGAPQTRIHLPVDNDWMAAFCEHYPKVKPLASRQLDHGSLVPLWFATKAGWNGPTCILGLPWDEYSELDLIGAAIAKATTDAVPTALIASGDMSHCLSIDAPCGYNPQGQVFDETFVDHLRHARFSEALNMDEQLRHQARQDVVESCRIAWQASNFSSLNHKFYSYEGPFGVGYTVMKFSSEAS